MRVTRDGGVMWRAVNLGVVVAIGGNNPKGGVIEGVVVIALRGQYVRTGLGLGDDVGKDAGFLPVGR